MQGKNRERKEQKELDPEAGRDAQFAPSLQEIMFIYLFICQLRSEGNIQVYMLTSVLVFHGYQLKVGFQKTDRSFWTPSHTLRKYPANFTM